MNDEPQTNIAFAEFEVDPAHRVLRREGEPVALKAKTFDLLLFLLENPNRVITKDEILEAVWAGQFVEEANLSVQVSALRKALGERRTAPRFLITIPGKGYKFVADIHQDEKNISENHKVERFLLDEEPEELKNIPPKQIAAGKRRAKTLIFALAGLTVFFLIGFAGYRYFSDPPKSRIKSLAVLPFVNQNNDPNTEYLSDGLADSVIYSLSSLPELRVMSRNSAFRFKPGEADAQTVGRELKVEAVLTGRISQFGDNLSISAELVSTGDNSVIWGEQFTRKISDIEKLQTDIAHSISQKLRLKLSGTNTNVKKNIQSENPEAYRLYLLGRYHLNKLTDEGFWKGRDYFEQAIGIDPNYAPAFAGLAEAYNRLCGYNALSPHEGFPKARMAAEKALELDDQMAEAHAVLGAVKHFYDWDFAGAEKEFERAVEINPNNSEARFLYSLYLSAMGRFDEALAEMRRAEELDPLSLEKIAGIGEIFYLQRQFDRAIEQYRKALEMDPNSGFAYWAIGRTLTDKGSYDEAVAALEKSIPLSGDSPDELVELARAYAHSGKHKKSLEILKDLQQTSEQKYISPTTIASIYAALGKKDEAFAQLEKAYHGRDFILVLLKVEPMFDPLRSDPRFAQLVQRVNLPR